MGSRSYVHLFETKLETPSLLLVLLFRGGSRMAGSLPTLRSLSRQSLHREMEPRSRAERGRENRPGLWPILPNTVCRRLATLARMSMCRAARLCARLVPAHTPQPHKSQTVPPVVCAACTSGRYHSHCPPAPRRAAPASNPGLLARKARCVPLDHYLQP